MLSCDQHDYIEIVCTFGYPIKLTLRSGEIVDCVALDTALNEQKEECISVEVDDAERLIVLADLVKLEVCVDNPHFRVITFD